MSWFEKLIPSRIGTGTRTRGNVPEGLWVKCEGCSTVLYRAELERAIEVCEKCGTHMRMNARARIEHLLDRDGREELDATIGPVDSLKFKDSKRYRDRLSQATKASGEKDALIVMRGRIKGIGVVVAVFDFRFMGGSMGSVVGEKFVRAAECCLENSLPLICFSASGGARMQEALYSLLQMGKTSSSLAQMSSRGLPYVSVLTDPTMGGVSASLAMLGDIIIAEPGARIGFAGPRVIEQTVREKLPEGFQSSEFLLEHGAIDMIVDRREMRDKLGSLLSMMLHRPQPPTQVPQGDENGTDAHDIDANAPANDADDHNPDNAGDSTTGSVANNAGNSTDLTQETVATTDAKTSHSAPAPKISAKTKFTERAKSSISKSAKAKKNAKQAAKAEIADADENNNTDSSR